MDAAFVAEVSLIPRNEEARHPAGLFIADRDPQKT
jgi:hypothetical protein